MIDLTFSNIVNILFYSAILFLFLYVIGDMLRQHQSNNNDDILPIPDSKSLKNLPHHVFKVYTIDDKSKPIFLLWLVNNDLILNQYIGHWYGLNQYVLDIDHINKFIHHNYNNALSKKNIIAHKHEAIYIIEINQNKIVKIHK